jgi:hypothetical protein
MKILSGLRGVASLLRAVVQKPPPPPNRNVAVAIKDRYEQGTQGGGDWRVGQHRLAGAPAPKFPVAQADLIVDSLYRALLGREPDPSGRQAFRPLVESGRLAEAVDAVIHSDEFRARAQSLSPEELSNSMYQGSLGRAPDPEGDLATRAALHRGHLAHRVLDMLLSPEHAQRMASPPPTGPVETVSPSGAKKSPQEALDAVAARHPELLSTNTYESTGKFIQLVLKEMNDPDWGYVGKTAGESQHTPAGFTPRWVNGHLVTGFSHDVIFHKPTHRQVDIIVNAAANSDHRPHIWGPAQISWQEIPPQHYRPNNPWLPATTS